MRQSDKGFLSYDKTYKQTNRYYYFLIEDNLQIKSKNLKMDWNGINVNRMFYIINFQTNGNIQFIQRCTYK